ncbi:MAG: hypothetical protein GXO58_07765 [Thermodesulfobacteria bacterium]|nr:hypothetical protein [Thermodesulfobacteriota bacterium]
MLEIIRKNAASWLMKFILGAIVVVFIFWGVGTFRSQRLDVMARVNGEKILVEDYQKAYNMTVERLRRMYGGTLPESLFKQLHLKEQVLNQLIDEALIRQEAARIGLRVTDKEVQQVILDIPAFKRNGMFDPRLYELALRNAGLKPADFEQQLRQDMITRKLQTVMASGLYCPDSEALSYFKYKNAQIDVEYIKVDSSQCTGAVNATDEQLKQWYEKHKEEFRTDPQIKLKYLLFSKKEFEKSANVTDAEIKAYYQEHQDEFHVPEQRRARHILLTLPKDANATVVEEKKKELLELKKRIEKGESFSELAKKYSDDKVSGAKGGDLGFFSRGMMVKPFEDKVFSMKKGEVSGPVRTRFGWHLIKLEDVRPARTKPLKEVRSEIEKKLKDKKVKKLVWDAANKAYDTIIEMGSLEDYAKTANKKLRETDFFSRKNPAPVLGFNPNVLDLIFPMEKGELSSLLEVPDGVMIAELKEKRAPYIPKFEKVKSKVKTAFISEKAYELCKKRALGILELAKKKGMAEAAKKYGLSVKSTGLFKRTDASAGGKLPEPVVQAALSLTMKKPFPEGVVESGRSFYVIHLKAFKETNDLAKFKEEKKAIKAEIRRQKAATAFSDWLKHQRERARIEIVRKP